MIVAVNEMWTMKRKCWLLSIVIVRRSRRIALRTDFPQSVARRAGKSNAPLSLVACERTSATGQRQSSAVLSPGTE